MEWNEFVQWGLLLMLLACVLILSNAIRELARAILAVLDILETQRKGE
jgi:hypothetical protein